MVKFLALSVLGLALVEARVRSIRTVTRKLQDEPVLVSFFPLQVRPYAESFPYTHASLSMYRLSMDILHDISHFCLWILFY